MEPIIEKKVGNLVLKLAGGDITRYPARAIVNAANKRLEHGGGVAYAIAKACAGNTLEYTRISKKAMREQIGRDYIEHGEVVVTPGMNLEKRGIRYVIHTVGPRCDGRWNDEMERDLYLAFLAPLRKAEELELESIAFPAVSAGIYGCPLEDVVRTFAMAVKDFSEKTKHLKEVSLVIYERESAETAKRVMSEIL